jgi:hypothetical protein
MGYAGRLDIEPIEPTADPLDKRQRWSSGATPDIEDPNLRSPRD